MLLSIIIFFILTIGFGFLIDIFIKNWSADFLEKLIIRIGAGILFIPILGVIFNLLHIPIYWPIFLLVALIIFSLAIYFKKEAIIKDFTNFKLKKSHIYVFFVLIIFAISAYMYIQGSFNYPWFEDGDPYSFATASKYISIEKKYSAPYYFTHFAEPYTQGYPIFMGLMHQTNNSIYWSMKFFNALIISFSILFFFYFARKLMKNSSMAFWATFTLAAIPAWLGHFVFALNFNMSLMLLLFYAFFSTKEDKNWKYLAAIFYGSIIITHLNTTIVITVFLLIAYFLKILIYKDFSKDYLDILILGFIITFIFWIPVFYNHWSTLIAGTQLGGLYFFAPIIQRIASSLSLIIILLFSLSVLAIVYFKNNMWFKYIKNFLEKRNFAPYIYILILIITFIILIIPYQIFYIRGSGDRIYSVSDFFIAQKGNMTNNPIGIGLVVMIMFLIGLFVLIKKFKKLFFKENYYLLIIFSWTIFSFIGVIGKSLSIGIMPFRMWTFFGFSLSLVTGYSIYIILKSFRISKIIQIILIILIIASVYYTSFVPKYWHNTATWPEHQIMVPESQNLYIWMREGGLPKDSMVINLCHGSYLTIGYDMLTKPWLNEELFEESEDAYYLTALNKSIDDNYNYLKRNNFDYVTLGASCIAKFDMNPDLLNNRIHEIMNSDKFSFVKNTKTEFLFKVN